MRCVLTSGSFCFSDTLPLLYHQCIAFVFLLGYDRDYSRDFGTGSSLAQINIKFFLIKQLVVNSKKIAGSAAGQTKRIGKNRSLLVFFEYSINHNNRTSV